MKTLLPKYPRILAIAPSTRGFGFALLEGLDTLVDWGVKSAKGDKNLQSLLKVKKLIVHYQPDVMVLENTSTKHSRRAPRIRALSKQILGMAESHRVSVALFPREQVRRAFFTDGQGTKYTLALIIAERFPELGAKLPPKRRLWMSEDSRMHIFDAVALALMLRHTQAKRNANRPVA